MEGAAARTGRILAIPKYEVIEEIGHGGMATVYRAHDRRLGRDVALKVIHPHLRDSPEVKHRFFVEAQAVAKLRHPNIVEVFDVSAEDDREQYLVVELLRGDTLRKLVRDRGALPPEVAACVALELLGALEHAHEAGVVHRDVKPENVMIEGGPPVAVKLMDFGIAKLLDAQGVTSTGQVLGSPAHMAPEQIEGGEVDERADVFGMGVLLYESMVGHLPFEGNNPAQVLRRVLDGTYPPADRERATVGKRWSGLVDRALAQKPEARFASAAAMRDAILLELAHAGVVDAKRELAAYFEDHAAYQEAHRTRVIEVLCARAGEARKRKDPIGAASDYNRALAYAPEDASLLKLVATVHRAQQRGRLVRRASAVLAGATSLCAAAFVLTRVLAPAPPSTTPGRAAASSSPALVGVASAGAPVPSSAAPDTGVASRADTPIAPPPRAPVALVPRVVEREIVIASTQPAFGVAVSVDGAEPVEVVPPHRLKVDGKAHVLRFTCAQELCEPLERLFAAGDKGETTAPVLQIRPATLIIEGDAMLTYQVAEEPSILARSGAPASVPMRFSERRVTVVELPTNRTMQVRIAAARETRVRFEPGP